MNILYGGAGMNWIKYVVSGEFLFAFYLSAGIFKSAINTGYLDITLILLFATVLVAIKRSLNNPVKFTKIHLLVVGCFFLILFSATVSLFYTPSSVYSIDKYARLIIITSWCFLGPFLLIRNIKSLRIFLVAMLLISVIVGISSFFTDTNNGGFVTTAFGSTYVILARVSAMGSIILLVFSIFGTKNMFKKWVAVMLSALLLIPLLESGARLPIILFLIVMLVIPLSMVRIKKRDILIEKSFVFYMFILSIVGTFGFILIKNGVAQTLTNRLSALLNAQGGGSSSSGRTERFSTAWQMSKESYFLGNGIGSFPIKFSGLDVEDYPHMIYLELLSELGMLSLISFVIIVLSAGISLLKQFKFKVNNTELMMTFAITLFWFGNSFVSSSINSDKYFYAFLAISILIPRIYKLNDSVRIEE